MTSRLNPGIYDTLLDQTLTDVLARYPKLRPFFGKIVSRQHSRSDMPNLFYRF